jgi:hypothetical protein
MGGRRQQYRLELKAACPFNDHFVIGPAQDDRQPQMAGLVDGFPTSGSRTETIRGVYWGGVALWQQRPTI